MLTRCNGTVGSRYGTRPCKLYARHPARHRSTWAGAPPEVWEHRRQCELIEEMEREFAPSGAMTDEKTGTR